MCPLSKSWLRPTATCHQIVVESTSTLKTCLRNHDLGPISSKSCALLGHQLSTHLLIEFYMIFNHQPLSAQIKLRSSAMVIIPHRTVQFFPPSHPEALISMTISWHGLTQHYHRPDKLSLHSPWSTALSQNSIIIGKHPHFYFSWPKYNTPPTAMASKTEK